METEWVRGENIGHGSFATICKAKPRKPSSSKLPPTIAVKSSETVSSSSLKNEKSVLDKLGACPQIIHCFGDQTTSENNKSFYNLLLEFAANGTLADQARLAGGRLPEPEVRRHARSILKGLSFIHENGFVHCDVKPQNVLVFGGGEAKIADFGLAKPSGSSSERRFELRGTPMYMSPEAVNEDEYEPPCDVWALGCAVAEMASGRSVWGAHPPGAAVWPLLLRIGGNEEPEIPVEVSELGRDFLNKCFVKDPRKRWTAQMLLSHEFVAGFDNADDYDYDYDRDCFIDDSSESSPRCPFDFPEWVSEHSPESTSSAVNRVRRLVAGCDVALNWSFSESWVTVRD